MFVIVTNVIDIIIHFLRHIRPTFFKLLGNFCYNQLIIKVFTKRKLVIEDSGVFHGIDSMHCSYIRLKKKYPI